MAIAVTNIGAADDAAASSATRVLTTTTSAVAIGEAVVVCFEQMANRTVSSVTDSAGNVYTKVVAPSPSFSAVVEIWWCAALTTALPIGGTITVTMASSSNHGVISAYRLSGGTVGLRISGSNVGTFVSLAGTTAGDIVIAAGLKSTNSGLTTPASWTNDFTGVVSSMSCDISHRTSPGGSVTYFPTGSATVVAAAAFYVAGGAGGSLLAMFR